MRGSKKSRQRGKGLEAIPNPLARVPRPIVQKFHIRRAWSQQVSYNPTIGWGPTGASGNMQINFAASQSNINIGGAAFYAPTLPSSSEFAAMFDQYKILGVTVRFDWSVNNITPSDISTASPLIYLVYDYDGSGDASLSDLLQYPGCITHSFLTDGYKPLIVSFSPRPLMNVASTGTTITVAPAQTLPYITTASMTVPHYGIKLTTASMGGSANTIIGYLMITAYIDLEFINPY